VALRLTEERQPRDGAIRVAGDLLEQPAELRGQALGGGGVEEIRAELQRAPEPLGHLDEHQRVVDFRGAEVEAERRDLEAGEDERGTRRVLQREHRLE
jgi:hypothetical protein